MSSATTETHPGASAALGRSFAALAERARSARTLRPGDVLFKVSGDHSGQYRLECRPGTVAVNPESGPAGREPLLEVTADAETLRAVLDGERDAREQFLKGGLRVRGDLRYLSDLALELGILDQPL